jgi:tRNA1Val (adenine37-N6)-methyltransferase
MPGNQEQKAITVLSGRVTLDYPPGPNLYPTTDAVFLAAACPVRSGQAVLDLGCGVGVVGLCIAARVPDVMVHGVDVDPIYIDYARRNAGTQGSYQVADIGQSFEAPSVHQVVINPPFFDPQVIDVGRRSRARSVQDNTPLAAWVGAAHRALVPGGGVTFLITVAQLTDLLMALAGRFGAIEIIPLWPRSGEESKRLIVRAIRDRKTPLVLRAGLIVHHDDGSWTDAAQAILRDAQAI